MEPLLMAPLPMLHRRVRKKSQNACWTCRRRHVRCDRSLPICENCVAQASDCDYTISNRKDSKASARAESTSSGTEAVSPAEGSVVSGEGAKRDAAPTALVPSTPKGTTTDVVSIVLPKATPKSTQRVLPADGPSFYGLPVNQHRLLYHMSSIATSIEASQSSNLAIYLKRLPTFLRIAFSYDFVMHSLMAWASSHLAFSTNSSEALNLSRHYRTLSMRGLQGAIGTFTEKNADAVLSASLLLGWQAMDPLEWATMNKGTSAVITAMEPWKQNSLFAGYIKDDEHYQTSPKTFKLPFNSLTDTDEAAALRYIHSALERVEEYALGRPRELRILQNLKAFVRNVESHLPINSPALRFYLLEPTRSMLFWYPALLFQEARTDPVVMLVLAHLYAISLTVQPVFAGSGAAHFRGLSTAPIEEIFSTLMEMHHSAGGKMESFVPLSLMQFPMQAVSLFRCRMGLGQDVLHADQTLTAIQYGLDPLVTDASGASVVEEG